MDVLVYCVLDNFEIYVHSSIVGERGGRDEDGGSGGDRILRWFLSGIEYGDGDDDNDGGVIINVTSSSVNDDVIGGVTINLQVVTTAITIALVLNVMTSDSQRWIRGKRQDWDLA